MVEEEGQPCEHVLHAAIQARPDVRDGVESVIASTTMLGVADASRVKVAQRVVESFAISNESALRICVALIHLRSR